MNLLQRILVGVVGIPAVYLIIRLGSWPLLVLAAAQAAQGSREFFALARGKYPAPFAAGGILLALLLPVAAFAGDVTGVQWIFPLAVLWAMKFIRPKFNPTPEKVMPYECGITPESDARGRYTVRFYIIAILFVVFDVEKRTV